MELKRVSKSELEKDIDTIRNECENYGDRRFKSSIFYRCFKYWKKAFKRKNPEINDLSKHQRYNIYVEYYNPFYKKHIGAD